MGRAATVSAPGVRNRKCLRECRPVPEGDGATGLAVAFTALQDVAPVSSWTSSPAALPSARSNPAPLALPFSQRAELSLPPGLCTCCFLRPECPPQALRLAGSFSAKLQLGHDISTEVFSD